MDYLEVYKKIQLFIDFDSIKFINCIHNISNKRISVFDKQLYS